MPDPYRHLLGGDPPDVRLSARVAALLDRMVLDRVRVEQRGADVELDETLMAVHIAALKFREHIATASSSGSVEVPALRDGSLSAGERIGCVDAGLRLGVSRRQVINLIPLLDGQKVGNAWTFDAAMVDAERARRQQQAEGLTR